MHRCAMSSKQLENFKASDITLPPNARGIELLKNMISPLKPHVVNGHVKTGPRIMPFLTRQVNMQLLPRLLCGHSRVSTFAPGQIIEYVCISIHVSVLQQVSLNIGNLCPTLFDFPQAASLQFYE